MDYSLSVLHYNINTSDVLSALRNTDITDNCSSPNPNVILTTRSEYYKYNNNILMNDYVCFLIENDINFMADTTSIINSTVSYYLYVPTVVGVCSQDINGVVMLIRC